MDKVAFLKSFNRYDFYISLICIEMGVLCFYLVKWLLGSEMAGLGLGVFSSMGIVILYYGLDEFAKNPIKYVRNKRPK
jgi:hypothetical protein